MTLIPAILLGLVMGVLFGLALEKARVMEPGFLIGQFQMTNFIMIKVMLSAIATGLVVLAVLHGLGIVQLSVKAALIGNMIVGGLLLGVGIVFAGACPGTALAQLGAGYKDAWAVLAGGLAGAYTYGLYQKEIDKALDWSGIGLGNLGKMTLVDLFPGGFVTLALIFAALIVVGLAALERWRPWRVEMERHDPTGGPGRSPGMVGGTAVPAE
jgi:uncharacterized membrane protein YedE/YeeE